jgi:hypothetical protein
MRSTKLVTTLVGVILATAAPAAYAMPAEPVAPPAAAPSTSDVPPPPSSIAMSAAEQYEVLRTPVGTMEVADEPSPPSGFDWVSGAIGAVAAAGLTLVSAAALTTRRRTAIG